MKGVNSNLGRYLFNKIDSRNSLWFQEKDQEVNFVIKIKYFLLNQNVQCKSQYRGHNVDVRNMCNEKNELVERLLSLRNAISKERIE